MKSNKILLGATLAATVAVVGWMAYEAATAPEVKMTTATLTPPKDFNAKKTPGTQSAPASAAAKPAAERFAAPKAEDPAQRLARQQAAAAVHEGLSHRYIVDCSACHGRDGKGPIGPSIAGKPLEKNLEILTKYKKGQVPNTMMGGLLEKLSESELKTLAEEISRFGA